MVISGSASGKCLIHTLRDGKYVRSLSLDPQVGGTYIKGDVMNGKIRVIRISSEGTIIIVHEIMVNVQNFSFQCHLITRVISIDFYRKIR